MYDTKNIENALTKLYKAQVLVEEAYQLVGRNTSANYADDIDEIYTQISDVMEAMEDGLN